MTYDTAIIRKEAVAAFTLTTGHDCITVHLFKIDMFSSLNCRSCKDPINNMENIGGWELTVKIMGKTSTETIVKVRKLP